MIVKKPGRYKMTKKFYVRNTVSCGTIPKGTIIEITQIDNLARKIIGPELMDWTRWDMPVIEIEDKCIMKYK